MSVDEEADDEMLLNFAAIFHFLTAGGGVHELWQASKYRLHSGSVVQINHSQMGNRISSILFGSNGCQIKPTQNIFATKYIIWLHKCN